ncbi:putative siderophore biosynthesis protein SbnA [Streptomyces sp. RB5]|uniref:Putative siderophore biosynthesis protein SbnA n=1 Tax=Streptomyces smaragdinus TaxID=2585196 RepID=A0A7K0CP02_9ACTN|nr:2,3-diaminopropionate biosynthesis protein SbnA [Streptomyces smaragdinus]MQY15208.1 putative siderophore biosynthesis protein SbnA [Streptomyces smaragdinus]
MPVISAPHQFNTEDLYVDLREMYGYPLHLKCEGFNFAGSIKLKAAASMIEAAENSGALTRNSTIVESSSGNLGVALSVIAAAKGYRFICVIDPRTNLATRKVIESLGSEVHMVKEPAAEGGFLAARLAYVQELLARGPGYIWLNQHANPDNWRAHYRTTAPQIEKQFPGLELLFVGAGTTGTLMGCARYFKDQPRKVTVVAVDSVGSVTFGGPPGTRMIPGLGTGVRPALLDTSFIDDVVHVPEVDTVRTCRTLARGGFLFGGSTGTVVSGAVRWLAENRPGRDLTAVALAPDLGERYLDTVYHPSWVHEVFGSEVHDEPTAFAELTDFPSGALQS